MLQSILKVPLGTRMLLISNALGDAEFTAESELTITEGEKTILNYKKSQNDIGEVKLVSFSGQVYTFQSRTGNNVHQLYVYKK